MLTRNMALGMLACGLLALPTRPARASGACEGMEVIYKLRAAALRARLLAFDVTVPFCKDDEEESATVVLVTNLELGARRWFATPKKGPEADAIRRLVGRAPLERAAAWPALDKAQGFRVATEVVLGGTCQGEAVALLEKQAVVPLRKAPAENNFSVHQLGVRLSIGGKPQEPVAVGTHAAGAKEPGLWVLRLPSGLRAYVATARCAGGPPPGTFGPDDAGSCYAEWQLTYKDLALPSPDACAAAPRAPASE